jgi:hypothetical protein
LKYRPSHFSNFFKIANNGLDKKARFSYYVRRFGLAVFVRLPLADKIDWVVPDKLPHLRPSAAAFCFDCFCFEEIAG